MWRPKLVIASRNVVAEILDHLDPADPRARASRKDLVKINRLIFHPYLMSHLLGDRPLNRILEIGAGDGQFMLNLGRRIAPRNPNLHVTLVDRQAVASPSLDVAFEGLGWSSHAVTADVFDFLENSDCSTFDVIVANLFLHHFKDDDLAKLLHLVSQKSNAFVACEPRRSHFGLLASSLLWSIGCNDVTRHDARVSILAGFRNQEISMLWPQAPDWLLQEKAVPGFSHIFVAEKMNV